MKLLRVAPLVLAAALLGGCAALSSVSSDVASFGEWPAGRAPGSYAFERLPSQQALAAETEALEADAPAWAGKRWKEAAGASRAEERVWQELQFERLVEDSQFLNVGN